MKLSTRKTLLKLCGLTLFGSGLGYLSYQIYRTQEILNNLMDTHVIDVMEPPIDTHCEDSRAFNVQKWLNVRDVREPSVLSLRWIWNRVVYAYARRLLYMANNERREIRLRAIKYLGDIKSLDNWYYYYLSHMYDVKTAVGLARVKDVDLRFFAEPPYRYLTYDHEMFVNTMKDFLVALHAASKHVCLEYFINEAFEDAHESGRFVDHDTHAAMSLSKFIKSADDVLTMCLEPILHHSSVDNYARDIVKMNGLPLLMEIYNRFKDNVDVNLTLSKIISNICSYPELIDDIFRSGWISILAGWLQNSDERISAAAAKSLANLDEDDKFQCVYPQKIYLLHPFLRHETERAVDVVFVHGLLGGVFYTWRQRLKNEDSTLGLMDTFTSSEAYEPQLKKSSDPNVQQFMQDVEEHQRIEWEQLEKDYEVVFSDVPVHTNEQATGPYTCPGNKYCVAQEYENSDRYTQCWPRDWLPKDFTSVRVIGVNYDTSLSMWAPICPLEHVKKTIEQRSRELTGQLINSGLGKRPIVWVTHSMGGLIVKKMLAEAYESTSPEVRDLCYNTKGVVFYSTPHMGSRIANINQAIALVLWPSVEVQELREESPHLKLLHEQFTNLVQKLPIKVISFVETKSTLVTAMKFNFMFVEPHSANPGVGEYFEIPQDHLCICKPLSKHSFLYQKLLDVIRTVAKESKT